MLLSALPLADKARRNIQMQSEHGLAHALAFTERTNVTRLHRAHRGQAQFVELAQCPLIHEARIVKIGCRLMDRPEGLTFICLIHDMVVECIRSITRSFLKKTGDSWERTAC